MIDLNCSKVDKEFSILKFAEKQLLMKKLEPIENGFIIDGTYSSNTDGFKVYPKELTHGVRDEIVDDRFIEINPKHESYMKYGATQFLMLIYGLNKEQAKNRALRLIKDDYEDKPQEGIAIQAEYILPGKNGLTINPGLLAEHIRKTLNYLVVRKQGNNTSILYIYEDGYYKLSGRPDLIAIIKKYIPTTLRKSNVWNNVYDDLVNDASHLCRFEDLNQDFYLINFRNGILNLKTKEIMKHDPKYKMTIQVDCNYTDEFTNNGVFDNYIDTLASGNENVKNMLLEFCGLAISNIPGHLTKKALSMYGKGDTGKSKLRELVQRLIGVENTCSYDLDRLESNPHATYDLYGKRIYGSADASVETARSVSVFKCLTGGDRIMANPKGKDGFDFIFQGVVWLISNPMIKFAGDKGDHVYERFLYVKCENVVPKDKRDRSLVDKMFQEKEYIAALFVHHLLNLIDNDFKFSGQSESDLCREEHRRENETFLKFLSEQYIFTNNELDFIVRSVLFREYGYYCSVNKCYQMPRKECNEHMENLHNQGKVIHGTAMNKGRVYRKIKHSNDAIKIDYDVVEGKTYEK